MSGDWGANLPPVATRITCRVALFWVWKRDRVEIFWVWTRDCTILPLDILRPVSPFSLLVLNSFHRLYSTCLCFLVKSGDMKIPLWAAIIEDQSLRALWSIDLLLSRLSNEIIMMPLFPLRCTLLIFTLPVISSTGSSNSDCNKSRSDVLSHIGNPLMTRLFLRLSMSKASLMASDRGEFWLGFLVWLDSKFPGSEIFFCFGDATSFFKILCFVLH